MTILHNDDTYADDYDHDHTINKIRMLPRLPAELLLAILDQVVALDLDLGASPLPDLTAVATSCRRLYSIITPLLHMTAFLLDLRAHAVAVTTDGNEPG